MLHLLAIAALAAPGFAAPPAQTAAEIIAAADAVRNPAEPFSLTTSLTEYRDGQQANAMSLLVYSKEDPQSGQYRTIASFATPPKDKGKVMLKNGGELWFYDPMSKSSVRISPQQRLMGQASNGDVMTANLHQDYEAALAGEETITDVKKAERPCFKLDLKAREGTGTYFRIEYWVEKGSFQPVKGKFYSDSDRLLKIVYYGGYKTELGRQRPTESIIIDGVDRKLVTKMVFSGYEYRKMPEGWFQKEYLPRFRGE